MLISVADLGWGINHVKPLISTKSASLLGGGCSLVAPPLDVPVMIIITIRLFVYQFIVCCAARCFATNVVVADYKNIVITGHVILHHTFTTEHIFKSFAIGIRGQNSFYGFYSLCTSQWNQDSLGGIVTRLWARCPRNFSLIPGRSKSFVSTLKDPDWLWVPSGFLFSG